MSYVSKMKLEAINVKFDYDDENGVAVEHKLKFLLDDAPGSSLESIINTAKNGDRVLEVTVGGVEFFGSVESSKVKFNYEVDGMIVESPLKVKLSTSDLSGGQAGKLQQRAEDMGEMLEITLNNPQNSLFEGEEDEEEGEEDVEETEVETPSAENERSREDLRAVPSS